MSFVRSLFHKGGKVSSSLSGKVAYLLANGQKLLPISEQIMFLFPWCDMYLISPDTIAAELSILNPADSNKYKTRASEYTIELENLDTHIKESISKIPKDHRSFMTAHESLGYLENRYNLNVIETVIPNLDSTIGPNPQNLVRAVNLIQENDIQVIFLENDTPDKSARTVANETGIKVVTGLNVETLSNKSPTYIDFMENNIQVIVENLHNYVKK